MAVSRISPFPGLILVLALAAVGIAVTIAGTPPPPYPSPDLASLPHVNVVRVIDGTTLRIRDDAGEHDVQLLGITTEGPGDPDDDASSYDEYAAAYLALLLDGETVYLDGASSSGAAYVYRAPDGLPINIELVRLGYARIGGSSGFSQRSIFEIYQQRAVESQKGMWSGGSPSTALQPRHTQVQPEPAAGSNVVYITKTGVKYHTADCGHLSKSKISISLQEARSRNYTPCKTCNPPQ